MDIIDAAYMKEYILSFLTVLGYGFMVESIVTLTGYSVFKALSLLNIK